MREKTVKLGDHFRKSDAVYPSVWVVTRVIHSPGVPTHYMLADVDGRGEVRTISEPTLVDPEYYTPVTPKSDPGQTDLEGNAPADEGRGVEGRDRDRARVRTDHHAMAEDGAWLGGLDAVAGQPHRR